MGHIIAAYDIGEEAMKVLNRVKELLEGDEQVILIYVVPKRAESGFQGFDDTSSGTQKAQEHVNDGIDWLAKEGINAVGLVESGNPVEVISDLAGELGTSMVVVGQDSRGMSGQHGPGFLARKLVDTCPRPVLVVK